MGRNIWPTSETDRGCGVLNPWFFGECCLGDGTCGRMGLPNVPWRPRLCAGQLSWLPEPADDRPDAVLIRTGKPGDHRHRVPIGRRQAHRVLPPTHGSPSDLLLATSGKPLEPPSYCRTLPANALGFHPKFRRDTIADTAIHWANGLGILAVAREYRLVRLLVKVGTDPITGPIEQ